MAKPAFKDWLAAYGAAWEARDAEAYRPLFTDDAVYHWTPFDAPYRGHDEICAAMKTAFARQASPTFKASVIHDDETTGWAQWTCAFTRAGLDHSVRTDGIMMVTFAADGRCCTFREWWHQLEPKQADLMRDEDA